MSEPKIRHLVLAGGGPSMLHELAVLQHLENNRFLSVDNLETIYASSSGGMVAVITCLRFDHETINDYILLRPWKDVFAVTLETLVDAWTNRGLFDEKTIIKCFRPLFGAKDIPLDITLEDFYRETHIELHLMTFEVNAFINHDLSYKTHPTLPVLKALAMSCALPPLFEPVYVEATNEFFLDGGVTSNYPLYECLQDGQKQINEILGIQNDFPRTSVGKDSTIADYFMVFMRKMLTSLSNPVTQSIPYEVHCDTKHMDFQYLKSSIFAPEVRKEIFEKGKVIAADFLARIKDSSVPNPP